MKNITKMLLSSAILATGTMAGEVMDVHQDIQNNGTINIVPDMKIKVEAGRWIINKGTINFMKSVDDVEAKFTVQGTDAEAPSGIKNKGPEFAAIEGKPTVEEALIDGATYFNLNNLGGTIQVKDPDNSGNTRQLNAKDYEGETGGIIQMEKDGLYNFLREGGDSRIDENNVIVLRGKHDVPNNMILLDHNDSDYKTELGTPLDITNTFVNADIYKTFQKDEEDPVEFAQSYALGVNGFFKFSGTNTNFNQEKVEFMDGSSEFTKANSIFGTNDLTISGGTVNINISDDDPVVLSGRTINVTSHKDADENDVYGCLVVTVGDVTLDKDSVLNLGYKAG